MAGRDKIEPFWARPPRGKRRTAPPLLVPERAAAPERDAPAPPPEQPAASPPPAAGPQEPSFAVSSAARRETIAAIVAGDSQPGEPTPAEPPPVPSHGGWIELSSEEAVRHPLFGVHGWLVAIAIFVALGLARALVELIDFWETTDHGGLAAWIMAILRSVMALWAALVLGLLLGRSRAFPTNFAAYSMVNVIYLVLFGLAFAHVTHGRVFAGVAVAIVLNLVAIAYVVRSRRVNVTYRHRIRTPKTPAPATVATAEASRA